MRMEVDVTHNRRAECGEYGVIRRNGKQTRSGPVAAASGP